MAIQHLQPTCHVVYLQVQISIVQTITIFNPWVDEARCGREFTIEFI